MPGRMMRKAGEMASKIKNKISSSEESSLQDKIRGNLRDAAKTDVGTGNLKKFKKGTVMVTSDKYKGRIVPDNKAMEKKYGKENIKDLPGSYSKGGRVNFKGGGCATKGKGKAYGKNS